MLKIAPQVMAFLLCFCAQATASYQPTALPSLRVLAFQNIEKSGRLGELKETVDPVVYQELFTNARREVCETVEQFCASPEGVQARNMYDQSNTAPNKEARFTESLNLANASSYMFLQKDVSPQLRVYLKMYILWFGSSHFIKCLALDHISNQRTLKDQGINLYQL